MSAEPYRAADLGHHGDAELEPGLVDLAVNVRAGAPPAWLRDVLRAAVDRIAAYPDARAARAAVAARHGRRADEVLLTAGAAEAFVLLARALTPRRAVVVHPQFTEPEAALRAAGHAVERVVLRAETGFRLDPADVPDDADLVVVGNPTNPTSVLHPAATLALLARPGRIVVVDEAFADAVPGELESLAGRSDLPGVVVVRSLTKTWGLAGLRLGYLLAGPEIARRLRAVQPLWPVSTPALAAAVACSEPAAVAEARAWAASLAADRAHLVASLTAAGWAVHGEPAASFVLARHPDAAGLRERARRRGYAVRRGDTFPGLGPQWVRVAVRDRATTDGLLAAFAEPGTLLDAAVAAVRPLDPAAVAEATDRQDRMTKPRGSLGELEHLSVRLAGLAGTCPPPLPEPAAVAVFAADHGVHAQGVSPWPQEVTAQMVGNFLAGGAVVNAFAAQTGASVRVVDVGVATPLDAAPGLLRRRVRRGTGDLSTGPAMSRCEALEALEVGIRTAYELVDEGHRALLTGDMGIANTTASAALVCAFTGATPEAATGRGTGVDDETYARKVAVVRTALALHRPDPADPVGVLAALGGLEHAALAGFLVGGAARRVPVVLDGVIAGAAALAAARLAPEAVDGWVAGHRSSEPGAALALAALGLRPLVDLGLRLGEGSGAVLALPIVQAAARALRDVATFDAAGVTDKGADDRSAGDRSAGDRSADVGGP